MWTLPIGLMRQPFSGSIPQTLDGIAGAADPLQAFADACGMVGFKPDFLWIGNEASGATELGGSGLGMTNTGVTQQQADARLGAGDTCLFNASTDILATTDNASLDIGTGSMAVFSVHAYDSIAAAGYFLSKYAASLGYTMNVNAGTGSVRGFVRTASGLFIATVNIGHGTANPQVDLLRRDTGATTIYLDTREGSGSVTETTVGNADNTAGLAVGGQAGSGSFLGSWGLTALVKGANAELVTATHRSNLQTWLGF